MNVKPEQTALWPVHPQPLPEELLSSWMIRLAHGNGLKVQTFYAPIFGKEVWTRDVDRGSDEGLIRTLAIRSGIPEAKLERLTLKAYEGLLVEQVHSKGYVSLVLQLGRYHRLHRRAGLMYCPQCWREDQEPFLRRSWRIAWSCCCLKHSVLLHDRCPSCQSLLQPHRADMRQRAGLHINATMCACAKCGFDLRRALSHSPTDSLIEFQTRCEGALENGYTTVGSHTDLHSLAFFAGIRQLAAGLVRARRLGDKQIKGRATSIELLPIADRIERFLRVAEILEDWPQKFLTLAASFKHPCKTFIPSDQYVPHWLYSVCNHHLRRDLTVIQPEEAQYIQSATEHILGRFTLQRARQLFDRNIGMLIARQSHGVSDDDAEMFMATIDQLISASSGKERLELLRDKVMFYAGRLWNLSIEQLRTMKVAELPVTALTEQDDRDSLDPEVMLRRWLRWYVLQVRSAHKRADSPWVFLCEGLMGQMSPSLVGARFQKAVKASGLERRIPSYSRFRQVRAH